MTARVVLHLPPRMIEGFNGPRPPLLYNRIRQTLQAHGADVVLRPELATRDAQSIDDGDLHIVENGRIQRAGFLNAATAYLEGFFHVDPLGVQAASSISALPYDPETIDQSSANAYLAALQQRFSLPRHSRYKQPRATTSLPEGAIAVFLQGPAPQRNGQAFCRYDDMLRAVCEAADGRPVVVKPHPLKPDHGLEIIEKIRAEGFAPITTAANVHDILAAAAVTVSVNSAACLEGFLHGKPAVLFGRSDFHHFVETVQTPAAFPAALARALTTPRNDARALFWYLGQHCLDITASSFDARLLTIFATAGFDANRLGLH